MQRDGIRVMQALTSPKKYPALESHTHSKIRPGIGFPGARAVAAGLQRGAGEKL
jgi:hypothetical protein